MQVVFSDAWWIGKKDDNPSEAKLPLPQHLIDAGVKAGKPVLLSPPAANAGSEKSSEIIIAINSFMSAAAAADDACTQEKANGKLSQAVRLYTQLVLVSVLFPHVPAWPNNTCNLFPGAGTNTQAAAA